MSYTIETWDHPSAPKGGKRWQLMEPGATRRCAKGTIDADGAIVVTAGHVPADAADWFEEACRKAAKPAPKPSPVPPAPARPVSLPAPAPEPALAKPKRRAAKKAD